MPHIFPFRAVRYAADTDLGSVTAPPYDVIPPEEAGRLELSHPHNIVRITLGAELEGDTDDVNRYSRAAAFLRDWLSSGILIRDSTPSFYLYRLDYPRGNTMGSTAGLIAGLTLEPLGEGGVFPHEQTTSGPKADRLLLMRRTRANLEPLWFFSSAPLPGFKRLVDKVADDLPVGDVADNFGVRHRLWVIPPDQAEAVCAALAEIPLVVADGHHRYETALDFRGELNSSKGPGPWDSVLAMISDPADYAPEVLPIHRLAGAVSPSQISGLRPYPGDLHALADEVRRSADPMIGVASKEGFWTMDSPGDLDTAFLSQTVLQPLGAQLIYEHDLEEVEKGISNGLTAFLMAPVPVRLVAEMALAGERMPPKTTLFWPKPRSGLVMRVLEPD